MFEEGDWGAKQRYPADYRDRQEDDNFCEDYFSSHYLKYIPSHHPLYCEADSRSSFEYFRTHESNSLRVAKGVIVDRTWVNP